MLCLSAAGAVGAQARDGHGQLLRLAPRPAVAAAVNASQSSNWFGYNQGALESGETLFKAIAGNWTVPKVSQHKKHEAEYASDWIGIGGGCENQGCSIQDQTLIQTGTEQDISASGKASYSAWWEVIPSPSVGVNGMKIRPGDRMHAAITEAMPGSWKIVLKDLSRHESYNTTVPYSSSQGTAEWIEETPLVVGSGTGFAPLPNLSRVPFDHTTANGHSASLKTYQEIELTSSSGKVVGVPSAPDPTRDGFNTCAWATACPAPHS